MKLEPSQVDYRCKIHITTPAINTQVELLVVGCLLKPSLTKICSPILIKHHGQFYVFFKITLYSFWIHGLLYLLVF
jgi:hypothetical protein